MRGMGRRFPAGYAEHRSVPTEQVPPFTSSLDWSTLGAVPEMLQTAHCSLTFGLDVRTTGKLVVLTDDAKPDAVTESVPRR